MYRIIFVTTEVDKRNHETPVLWRDKFQSKNDAIIFLNKNGFEFYVKSYCKHDTNGDFYQAYIVED